MGKVFLVGAGPGAADLLTVRATRLLQRADIVFHDALIDAQTLAIAERAQKVSVGKRCGAHSTAQRFINKRLVDAAAIHETVVRLKGGDPMLFGRAQEELDALEEAGVEFEIVPGVTAALAASALSGVSLTRRGVSRSVLFATPRIGQGEAKSDWIAGVLAADTAVLYMAYGEVKAIARELIERGAASARPVALVRGASLPGEETVYTSLVALSEAGLPWPAGGAQPVIVCIGEVYAERLREVLEGRAEAFDSRCRVLAG